MYFYNRLFMKKICLVIIILISSLLSFAQVDEIQTDLTSLPANHEKLVAIPNSGEVKGFYPDGAPFYAGEAKAKKLHGGWQSWYSSGMRWEEGSMEKGIPDGAWQVWYPDGRLQFVRNYSADKWQRFQLQKKQKGTRQIIYPITSLYSNNRNEAMRYLLSSSVFNSATGDYYPVFEQGLLHGTFINYFPNGDVKDSGHYENGLPHGIWVHYSIDRQQYSIGAYHHGVKHQEWKTFLPEGKLEEIIAYKNGKEIWRKKIKNL